MVRRAFGALVALALCLGSTPALAHAVLLEADPADGERLDAPPVELALRFSEPVRLGSLRIVGSTGLDQPLEASGPPDRPAASLPGLAPGTYVASWRVVSQDGHPVAGSLAFVVGPADGVSLDLARAGVQVPPALVLAHGAARVLTYAGGLAGAGALLFLALFGANRAVDVGACRRLAAAAALVGLLGTAAAMLTRDAIAGDAIAGGGLAPDMAEAARMGGLAVVAAGAAWRPASVVAGPLGAVLVAGSFALSGHTVSLGSTWSTAALALHLLAVAFWLGSFGPLLRATRSDDVGAARDLMAEFSSVAVVLVPALAACGLLLALVLVGSWAGLATAYGAALLVKTGLVVAMLLLAAANKRRLAPGLGRRRGAADGLRRSIRAEAGLGVAVLVATAALTSGHPPGPAGARPWPLSVLAGDRTFAAEGLVLTVPPGGDTLILEIRGPDGAPRDVMRADLLLSSPGRGVEGISRRFERAGPGLYRTRGIAMVLPGDWRVRVDLLVSDFERSSAEFVVPMGALARHDGH